MLPSVLVGSLNSVRPDACSICQASEGPALLSVRVYAVGGARPNRSFRLKARAIDLNESSCPRPLQESWKHPDKRDYFFGAHDDNRLQFTVGRDIRLDPPQQGDPLNYFIYPYVELDGKPFAVESKFSFQDRINGGD
jgi:hypothetical protein